MTQVSPRPDAAGLGRRVKKRDNAVRLINVGQEGRIKGEERTSYLTSKEEVGVLLVFALGRLEVLIYLGVVVIKLVEECGHQFRFDEAHRLAHGWFSNKPRPASGSVAYQNKGGGLGGESLEHGEH